MAKPLPYITAALFCEKVLQEKDGSLTFVRMADRIQYKMEGPNLPPDLKPAITLHGIVGVKSGPVTGEHVLKFISEKPNGERKEVFHQTFNFLGKDQGHNVILNMSVGIDQDGLYWLDVFFDDELLTRIPLVITPLEEQKQPETNT